METRYLNAGDGTRLHVHICRPARSPVGRVLLVHGLSEHAGRYHHLMDFYSRHRLEVFAPDLRGHGRSDGLRGDVPDYRLFLDDIDLLLDECNRSAPLPTVLHAHSMGGGIVANWLTQRHHSRVRAAVLTAPWFRLTKPVPGWKEYAFRLGARMLPTWRIPATPPIQDLTGDPDAVKRYLEDPLFHRTVSLRLAVAAYDAGLTALDAAAKCPLPVLALHSPDDKVTLAEGTSEFCNRVPQATFRLLPGLAHELHNETGWQELFGNVADWMLTNCETSVTL
ncbi:MAG: lysophospholipase [Planctomycetaceae bacterium]|nr:lysophospholipase [Planctomycetaceae bacterium]